MFKGDDFASVWDAVIGTAENIEGTEIPATFRLKLSAKINYVNPETGTNVLWANANATKHMGKYVGRIVGDSQSIGLRSQVMLESFQAAINEAMEQFILYQPIRCRGVFGNWEIGNNTRTGVIYHARMIH